MQRSATLSLMPLSPAAFTLRPAALSIRNLISFGALLLLAAFSAAAHAQAGEWVWMGGSTIGPGPSLHLPAVYGTLGVPAPGNWPGSLKGSATWTDVTGHLWLFSGFNGGNDLWEFDPSINEWTWMGGAGKAHTSGAGVYGKLGIAAPGNYPGGRISATTWTDHNGNFWLFGGYGDDSTEYGVGDLNDLWEFNPSTREWTWMAGSDVLPEAVGLSGVYGTLGHPAPGNTPGGREGSVGWTDSSGNLWLFGGYGYVYPGWVACPLNDLWMFNPSSREWAWMGGSREYGLIQPGVYGKLGIPDAANVPGGRNSASSWTDREGNFWLFGGMSSGAVGDPHFGPINDLWRFNPSSKEWTWMGGRNGPNWKGVYGKLGVPSTTNMPGGRYDTMAWADESDNFWIFSGNSTGDVGDIPNDLWQFNPLIEEFTWMGGNNSAYIAGCNVKVKSCMEPGVYGTLGVLASSNLPGSRTGALVWMDNDNHAWMYGGQGNDALGQYELLDDLWEFFPAANNPQAATPVLSLAGGNYALAQTVSITDATKGAKIYYTLDGSWPNSNSALYTKPVSIAKTATLTARAEAPGYVESAPAIATYAILGLPQTITFPQPGPFTWGQQAVLISATASSGLPVTVSVLLGWPTMTNNIFPIVETGVALLGANQAGNSVWAAAPQVTRYVWVNKVTLTVTALNASMTYGGGVPKLSYTLTGFVKGDDPAHAAYGSPSLSTTATAQSAVGSYAITASMGTLQTFNYIFHFVPGALTVNKAALAVTANNLTMKQGAAVPSLTYTMAGFLNGDVQGKATTGAPKLPTTATSKSAVGSYPITVGAGTLAAGNYSFAFVNGTLTVTK